jgi:hypothetical protein
MSRHPPGPWVSSWPRTHSTGISSRVSNRGWKTGLRARSFGWRLIRVARCRTSPRVGCPGFVLGVLSVTVRKKSSDWSAESRKRPSASEHLTSRLARSELQASLGAVPTRASHVTFLCSRRSDRVPPSIDRKMCEVLLEVLATRGFSLARLTAGMFGQAADPQCVERLIRTSTIIGDEEQTVVSVDRSCRHTARLGRSASSNCCRRMTVPSRTPTVSPSWIGVPAAAAGEIAPGGVERPTEQERSVKV